MELGGGGIAGWKVQVGLSLPKRKKRHRKERGPFCHAGGKRTLQSRNGLEQLGPAANHYGWVAKDVGEMGIGGLINANH